MKSYNNNVISIVNTKLQGFCEKAKNFGWWSCKDYASGMVYYRNLRTEIKFFCKDTFKDNHSLTFFQDFILNEVEQVFTKEVIKNSISDENLYTCVDNYNPGAEF